MSAAPRILTTRYRSTQAETTICPGCRTELPINATFCVECGLCMLDVTSEGTVIVRSSDFDDEPDESSASEAESAASPVRIVDDTSSAAIELSEDDVELDLDIDALVAGLLETVEPGPDERMTSRFKPVPINASERDVSATLSSDLSDTMADEIEVDLSDSDIDTFFEEVSSPIRLGRGPLTPLSQWPAPDPGNTVVGPPPTH